MKPTFFLSFVVFMFVGNANAGEQFVMCAGEGLRQNGTSENLPGFLDITFTRSVEDGKITLKNIKGTVKAGYEWDDGHDEDPFGWEGEFEIEALTEKENYRPRVYKGHSKFEDFDATTSEMGMWGYFVLERHLNSSELTAAYVFQSGDHMGGTIDVLCEVEDEE